MRRPQTERFDANAIGERIVLRHWRPGDRFQPIGMKSPVKLQDLFANAKVSRSERHVKRITSRVACSNLDTSHFLPYEQEMVKRKATGEQNAGKEFWGRPIIESASNQYKRGDLVGERTRLRVLVSAPRRNRLSPDA